MLLALIHACMHVCLCVRAWFWMYICVHVCMSVYVCLCVLVNSFMRRGICVCADKPAHVCLWRPEVDGGSCSRPSSTLFIKQVSTPANWIAPECPVSTFRELGLRVGHHAAWHLCPGIQAQVLTFTQKVLYLEPSP